MNNNLKDYLSDIVESGLEKDYWFMTKQAMSDFYFIYLNSKVVKTYLINKKPSESYPQYYSRFFKEDKYLSETYRKQAESNETYRNTITAEYFGLIKREGKEYEKAEVTEAYELFSRYAEKNYDVYNFRYAFNRQLEKLCLNINKNLGKYSKLSKVTNFPVMYLYKILFELYKKTNDSTLYYDEFVVFLVRSQNYASWENTLNLILSFRENNLDENLKQNYDNIFEHITTKNIRFDSLFGLLDNIEYSKKKNRKYYKIKDSYESLRYIENAIEIFEASKYSTCNSKNEILQFIRSDKYFIGNLDVAFTFAKPEKETEDSIPDESERINSGVNIILYGVPGAGKSYVIENEYIKENTKIERVVFHPDYTYSDFVGQILPKTQNGDISYQFIPGPFTKIMKEAYRNPKTNFILIIEEINRGNAPAIFGDIFQLLDRKDNKTNKEGESSYGITNSDIAKIIYNNDEHQIRIPSNLSIICTMNTSDQNVFTLDTAFQRRWNMRLIENSFKKNTLEEKIFAEKKILDTKVTWEQFCCSINKHIIEKNQNLISSDDKRLGTHFVNIDDLTYDENEFNDAISEELRIKAKLNNRRFPEKIVKYLWDDAFKFYRNEIFKDEFDSLEKVIKEFSEKQNNDRFNIFKDNIKASIEEIVK